MSIIEFKDFNFSYSQEIKLLSNINLEIESGEFVLIAGPSGSGKSTLLSNLKKELAPKGEKSGEIRFNGQNINDLGAEESACDIGYLFQNPDSQIVTDTVIQEISFPLENIGAPRDEIRNRLAEMVAFFGIEDILHKNVNELSGGQKQLVSLCSLLVLKPKVLLLDEPTSQLDPIASYDFLTILRRLNEEFSITIILIEHNADNLYQFLDRVVFLDDGKIIANDCPGNVANQLKEDLIFKQYLPAVTNIYFLMEEKFPELKEFKPPFSIKEGRTALNSINTDLTNYDSFPLDISSDEEILNCKNIYFGYNKDNLVLNDVDFQVNKGDFVSIIGGNGSGKSTLLQILAGFMKPIKGKVNIKADNVEYVHQNPMIHFSKDNVGLELFGEDLKRDNDIVDLFGISHLLDKHPYDCSGGEQQKIAVVKALLKNPDVLILDEPTKGLDPISNKNLAKKLKVLQKQGLTIIMATHDLSFVGNYCNRCIMLFDSNVQIDSTPRLIFTNNNFYTTFVNRVVKDYMPDGINLKDVEKKWIL